MRLLDLEAIYPKPKMSEADPEHRKYPYLLRGIASRPTGSGLVVGHLMRSSALDWHSRYVFSWRLLNSRETTFCVETRD